MKTDTELETERLIIRHFTLSDDDRNFFHFINSNEIVRQFYVTRMSREKADEILEAFVLNDSTSGLKWGVASLKSSGQPIGFTGLGAVEYETPFTPCVEIGWLYNPDFWGQGYATEAGQALLEHGFEDVGLNEIVAFAVHNNNPSISVMNRLGMKKVEGGDFDHPKVPDSHADLQRHVLYSMSSEDWKDQALSA